MKLNRIGGPVGNDYFQNKYGSLLINKVWADGNTHVCRLTDGSLLAGGRATGGIVKYDGVNFVYCYNLYECYIAVASDGSVFKGKFVSELEKIQWNLKT